MEEFQNKSSEKSVSNFKSQDDHASTTTSPLPVQKSGISRIQHPENSIVSLTPDKKNETHSKPIKADDNLPERFKIILELFDRMTCSLRLLNLRRKSPTFQHICSQVEILSGRKFAYKHLAQIKYILPEAVKIDRVLKHDEETMCMKPDMEIVLLFDLVEGHEEHSVFIALHKIFASRLEKFSVTHPKVFDVPQAVLPEPFNKESIVLFTDLLPLKSSMDSSECSTEVPLNSTHLPSKFSRQLSKKTAAEIESSSSLVSSPSLSLTEHDWKVNQNTEFVQQKTWPDSSASSTALLSPMQQANSQCGLKSSDSSKCTPLNAGLRKLVFVTETPSQITPKRSASSCDDECNTITTCNVTAKRSLDFSEDIKQDKAETLQKSFLQKEEANCVLLKENSCLSDLVATIHLIFQSIDSSSITKEELVHKILVNNFDYVKSREVEELLDDLEKLAPDWICKMMMPSGDLLYSIKKALDVNLVRERLES